MKIRNPIASPHAPEYLSDAGGSNAHLGFGYSLTRPMLTTNELADGLKLRPQTLYKRYSQYGHVFGLKPVKLSSGRGGRLLWPADSLEQIAARGA